MLGCTQMKLNALRCRMRYSFKLQSFASRKEAIELRPVLGPSDPLRQSELHFPRS